MGFKKKKGSAHLSSQCCTCALGICLTLGNGITKLLGVISVVATNSDNLIGDKQKSTFTFLDVTVDGDNTYLLSCSDKVGHGTY